MSYFDVSKDDLIRLTDVQLEKFIARLAEAEVASHGLSPSCVHWSGSITTPDGGVDVRVDAGKSDFNPAFISRPNTIFQAKLHSMPPARITNEMSPAGMLAPAIAEQARNSGGYIIVSLKDDCSESMKKSRIAAMQAALKGKTGADDIHLDFYDCSKLLQWLRQHPSAALWVRDVLGKPLPGWQPYGAWSKPPEGVDDALILEAGVSISLPGNGIQKRSIEDAIAPMRRLVGSSNRAIRIVGLSGVGKTRIVQALFDETVGDQPLDRTTAIYTDTGAAPDPSAQQMLDRLIAEDRTAVLIIDNCPSDLHGRLASRVASVNSSVRLITVEYDIRDDKPQTTEVIHIEADGPEIAEKLLLRRYPKIGPGNAHRIAEFADGNARVALAVAERVEIGESLAHLSDADLFDRLFVQRKEPDGQLRQHAQLLALVYSFSVDSPEAGTDELTVLGSIHCIPRHDLFRSVAILLERQVAQKRSHWRALMPHAIANRLASEALNSTAIESLRSTFESAGHERLLMSFAHRLGLMHDHDVAKSIVRSWLEEDGPLASISNLDENCARILEYAAPVAPDAVLDRIETLICSPDFAGMPATLNSRRTTILILLTALAYEPGAFDRCIKLLLRVADFEDESNNYDAVGDRVVRFFQAYLSGTHASLDQRLAALRYTLNSNDHRCRKLGFRMLSTALDGPPWSGMGMNDFGARPRDFGFDPDYDELVEWYSRFIDIAVEYGMHEDNELARQARQTLAQEFQELWFLPEMREKLVVVALTLNTQCAWVEGWKAVRKTISLDYSGQDSEPVPPELVHLAEMLAPSDLMDRIKAYVLGQSHYHWSLDEEFDDDEPDASEARLVEKAERLGDEFALTNEPIATLGVELFSADYMPYRTAFGRGLASGAVDKQAMWDDLVMALNHVESENCDLAVLAGFIEQLDSEDRPHAQHILDQCLDNPRLRQELVSLHPVTTFDEGDLERCIMALEVPDVKVWMYDKLLWKDPYSSLPAEKLTELATKILAKPNGERVLLHAISMKLHGKDPDDDVLGAEFRRLGLMAATRRLLSNQPDPGGTDNHHMKRVLRASLQFEGNEHDKAVWLDAIFDVVDSKHGHRRLFNDAARQTAELMPNEFLGRVFIDDDERRRGRFNYVERGSLTTPVLSSTNVETLIAWCKRRNDPKVWKVIAAGLQLWVSTDGDNAVQLTDAAVRFLEASPVPEDILRTYASKISPWSWSGSRAEIMERRAQSFKVLFQQADPHISALAQEIVAEETKRISNVRQREHRLDEEREQRFE